MALQLPPDPPLGDQLVEVEAPRRRAIVVGRAASADVEVPTPPSRNPTASSSFTKDIGSPRTRQHRRHLLNGQASPAEFLAATTPHPPALGAPTSRRPPPLGVTEEITNRPTPPPAGAPGRPDTRAAAHRATTAPRLWSLQ